MTLLKLAETLRERAIGKEARHKEESKLRDFREVTSELVELQTKIAEAESSRSKLVELGIEVPKSTFAANAVQAIEGVVDPSQEVAENLSGLLKSPLRAIDQALTDESDAAKSAFREWFDLQFPNLGDLHALATALGEVDYKASLSLKSVHASAATLRSTGLRGDGISAEVKALKAEIDRAITATGMSDVVRNFVERLSSGGASFDQLTSEVELWIDEHKLRDRLRIRLAGNQ